MRLGNKVALISGGARGMGAVEAKLFANEGAKVVIGDVLEKEGHQVEAEINESGGECLFVPLDVTDEADWESAVATAVSQFGKLDILVNNAGILRSERVEETTSEVWDLVMEVNAKGVFLGTKTVIPELKKLKADLSSTFLQAWRWWEVLAHRLMRPQRVQYASLQKALRFNTQKMVSALTRCTLDSLSHR